ncbi:hypothetical protein [Staphylococcus debuckii]|uniref:hypothetical protein n=1 Tax=Staphylococcus debuckii TaxID=2044912 RepID=UPI000F438CF3|nr:hypothetical protein [Staphylococcus debuckii]AYU54687.1 hypothetical protein CNQ82_04300 [Staphylococcus debuckii]
MEIKYPLDENQEQYFAATHKEAVQGIDLDDLENSITGLQNNFNKTNSDINDLMNFKNTVIGDTGWVNIQMIPSVDNNSRFGNDGFSSAIREIRVGNIRMKSVRLNLSKVPHDVQIAQLPIGFITKNQYFNAVTNGNVYSIKIAMETDGKIRTYINKNDQSRTDLWIYQQFTWIE